MAYELKRGGAPAGTFDTEAEAVAAASAILREDADAQLDITDAETGKPAAPGSTGPGREDLAKQVGF